jgi:hypothetical protein
MLFTVRLSKLSPSAWLPHSSKSADCIEDGQDNSAPLAAIPSVAASF